MVKQKSVKSSLKNNGKDIKNKQNKRNKKDKKINISTDTRFVKFYKKSYKKLLIIPIIMFIFGVIMIVNTYKQESSPIYRDISLKGGLSSIIEIESDIDPLSLQNVIEEKFIQNSFAISELSDNGKRIGFIIDTDLKEEELIPFLNNYFKIELISGDNYTSNFISEQLSNSFFSQAMYILLISFILMSLVVFMYFREFVPSFAVVLSAIFDIVVTVGILNFLEYKISIAGIGALLMLIGYSIDTDVLLTNRLIKEKGDNYLEKTFFAFKTGTLMTFTTFMASLVALFITNSPIISEIVFILITGLLVDFISTWVQNSAILLWWIEKRNN